MLNDRSGKCPYFLLAILHGSPVFLLNFWQLILDSVSLKDRWHICLPSRMIKIMFLFREKFGQVCKQPPCMIGGFLRSRFLSCDVNPLCVWHLLWKLRDKENVWEYKDYATYCAMSNEILGFWPKSLMSFFNILLNQQPNLLASSRVKFQILHYSWLF